MSRRLEETFLAAGSYAVLIVPRPMDAISRGCRHSTWSGATWSEATWFRGDEIPGAAISRARCCRAPRNHRGFAVTPPLLLTNHRVFEETCLSRKNRRAAAALSAGPRSRRCGVDLTLAQSPPDA